MIIWYSPFIYFSFQRREAISQVQDVVRARNAANTPPPEGE